MADKHSVKKIQLEKTLILPSEGIPLASKRLDALCEEFRREKLDKIHKKRRRKYNKRHKLESSRPEGFVDPELKKQSEELTWDLIEVRDQLFKKREEGFSIALLLQKKAIARDINELRSSLAHDRNLIQSYINTCHVQEVPSEPLSPCHDHLEIIKDLEATIVQCEAMIEIRKMKHTMTPRVPQLHNRTLSGNILDQSLGILHDTVLLENGFTMELMDSEQAQLQIIGKEVSISQEDSENIAALDHMSNEKKTGDHEETWSDDRRVEIEPVDSNLEKLSCSDDTPGIGREVVCIGDSESVFSSHPITEMEIVSSHNGIVNGGMRSIPTHEEPKILHSTTVVQDDNITEKTVDKPMFENLETETDDWHRQILQFIQDAHYDLRFPISRYNNQSNKRIKSTVSSESPSKTRKTRQSENSRHKPTPVSNSVTPTPRKRGRPRKNPLPPA